MPVNKLQWTRIFKSRLHCSRVQSACWMCWLDFNHILNAGRAGKWDKIHPTMNHSILGFHFSLSWCQVSTASTWKERGSQSEHLSIDGRDGRFPEELNCLMKQMYKTPLFTVFSAHTQIASMLMLREHMSCLFATIRRFFMTCVDTFSSQHIETA